MELYLAISHGCEFKIVFTVQTRSAGYIQFNSIQVYLYNAFYNTIVAKQLHRKLRF